MEKVISRLTLIKNKQKINDINAYLLIAFAFFLPLTVAVTNIIMAFIVLLWLLRGTFKEDWNEVKDNKVVLAVLGFYLLHIVGLLWTEDMNWGLHILKKETKFLLLPIFMLFVKVEHIKYYIYAFLSAMLISVFLSYGVWFEILPEFKHAHVKNPVPFMSHISYNPFLAVAIYLLISIVLFSKYISLKIKLLMIPLLIIMSIDMFITEGRGGQVMFFSMMVILLFQYFNTKKMKAFFLSILIVPAVFFISYKTSEVFQNRVDKALTEITNFNIDDSNAKISQSSMGTRMTFLVTSYEIIKKNIFLGVGVGDFKVEYLKVRTITDENLIPDHPHNMYLLILTQLGLLGLVSLLSILYFQIKVALINNNMLLRNVGIALPIMFSIIMLSDSYLLGHFTSMLFIFLSAFLYKTYENEEFEIFCNQNKNNINKIIKGRE